MAASPPTRSPSPPERTAGSATDPARGKLPSVLAESYRELAPIAALDAECAFPLWTAVERSSGQTAVLTALGASTPERRIVLYDRCAGSWPEHYGVPRVLDASSPDVADPHIAWAVETGGNLRAQLERGDSPSPRRVLEIGRAVAETLAELHRFGAQAGHLTPATIWIGPAGICQILGLGLGAPARDAEGEGQRYRAPERLRREASTMAERLLAGDLGERADVWSLGIILMELLEGRPRLSSRTADELVQEQAEISWRPPDHVTPELADLLAAMLTLDPLDRSLGAEEVAARLDDLLLGHQTMTAPRSAVSRSAAATRGPGPDPPLPIPSRPAPPPDWRQAVRSVQERRRAFESSDSTPAWKIWLLPGVGLALVLLLLWLLSALRPPP